MIEQAGEYSTSEKRSVNGTGRRCFLFRKEYLAGWDRSENVSVQKRDSLMGQDGDHSGLDQWEPPWMEQDGDHSGLDQWELNRWDRTEITQV